VKGSYAANARASSENLDGRPPVEIIGKTPQDTALRMLVAGLWPIPLYSRGVELASTGVGP
jgi:hypothetical protein